MHNYAGNPDSFPVNFAEPDDANISAPNAAVFNTAYEALGDRTAALANGYRTELANTAALKAIDTTLLPDGAIRTVANLGRFKLDKTIGPTDAEDLPIVVAPTTGTGRWFAQDRQAKVQWTKTFTTLGGNTFTMPRNLSLIDYEVIGGGGGGGGGSGADTSASDSVGGGGGGGARASRGRLAVAFGSYIASVGDGGAGGAANTNGADGGASALLDPTPNFVAFGWGGGGGAGGTIAAADTGSLRLAVAPGGRSVALGLTLEIPLCYTCADIILPIPEEQRGGFGTNSQAGSFYNSPTGSAVGENSHDGGSGGNCGVRGTAGGGHIGGGAGGGGGAGPLNASTGGAGGNGGNGSGAGAGANGTAGASPPAGSPNYGGGGGGGGGAGQGSTGGGLGGAGGKGAPGRIFLRGVV